MYNFFRRHIFLKLAVSFRLLVFLSAGVEIAFIWNKSSLIWDALFAHGGGSVLITCLGKIDKHAGTVIHEVCCCAFL